MKVLILDLVIVEMLKLSEISPCEKWVEGYEGLYSVTSCGEIFTHKSNIKKVMRGGVTYRKNKFSDDKVKMYRNVTLRCGSIQKNHYVHRLVASAFLEPIEGKNLVNHIDGVKTNNMVENLEWVTDYENKTHAKENDLLRSGPSIHQRNIVIDSVIASGDLKPHTKSMCKEYVIDNPEYLSDNGVPPEMASISKTMSNRGLLDDWNYYVNLFRLCDSSRTPTEVSKLMGLSLSMISLIRNGKRAQDARVVYEKYKNDIRYVNF